MEFVTGKAGTNHISGADMAAMYRGLLIADDVVLSEGDKLACTMLDANTVEIATGSCMLQAHHCRVETAEQVTIESGSAGFKRNDLIVARYSLGDGNIQTIYLAVVKGTAVAGEPSDPTVTTGSIDGGDVLVEFPLWRIPIDGVSVGTPERVMPTVDTLQKQLTDGDSALQTQITALGESVTPQYIAPTYTAASGVTITTLGVHKANHVVNVAIYFKLSSSKSNGAALVTFNQALPKPVRYAAQGIVVDAIGGVAGAVAILTENTSVIACNGSLAAGNYLVVQFCYLSSD